MQGRVNSSRCIACLYTVAAKQRGVQQLLWSAKIPDLLPTEHVWDLMKLELTLSPEPATTIAELRQRVQDTWHNLSQDDIRHLYDHFHARMHDCVENRWAYFLNTPHCDMCVLFGLNLLSYTLTMINYLSHCNTMNLSLRVLRVLNFFQQFNVNENVNI